MSKYYLLKIELIILGGYPADSIYDSITLESD